MFPAKFGVELPRDDKATRTTRASFSTAADFTHLCLTRGNKATTAIAHHARAMLQMHECELKNSQPAILSPRCSPIIFSVNVIKEKAGSLPRDWLEPCSSFVRPSNSVLRWGRQRKSVCVCVVKPGTDSWHLMAFLAAGVFERILSKGWILVAFCLQTTMQKALQYARHKRAADFCSWRPQLERKSCTVSRTSTSFVHIFL